MKNIRNKFFPKIILGLLVIVVVSVGLSDGAHATISAYGRTDLQGYFSGQLGPHGVDVLPPLHPQNNWYCGGTMGRAGICDAIPQGEVDSVPALITLLMNSNRSGQPQKVTGSAFVVYTMLGRGGNNYNRIVSSSDWNELTDRLNSAQDRGLIQWNGYSSKRINSLWQGSNGVDDDAFFEEQQYTDANGNPNGFYPGGASIIIYSQNWGPFQQFAPKAYELMRECANPLGQDGPGGIPQLPNYSLAPHATIDPNTAEVGQNITVNSYIKNNPNEWWRQGPTPSRTQWQVNQLIIQPGKFANDGNESSTLSPAPDALPATSASPCGFYQKLPDVECRTIRTGSGPLPANTETHIGYDDIVQIPDNLLPGTRVCFVVSVQPSSHTDAGSDEHWVNSSVTCTTVGKRPKLQILGGDVRVGVSPTTGQIDTSTSTINGRTYGSWVEYGALATGSISGFASGAGYGGVSNPDPTNFNNLTFANTPPGLGHFSLSTPSPSLIGQFENGTAAPLSCDVTSPGADLNCLSAGTYKVNGDLTINKGNIFDHSGAGKTIVIIATGKVKINGDIRYKAPDGGDNFSGFGQIPQVIIVAAGGIDIGSGATNVDAWLLTTHGYVNTCGDVPVTPSSIANPQLNSGNCPNKLTINGPIVADKLYLWRTAGANAAQAGDPAEVLNLRADAILWAQTHSAGAGKVQTIYTSELPPRF